MTYYRLPEIFLAGPLRWSLLLTWIFCCGQVLSRNENVLVFKVSQDSQAPALSTYKIGVNLSKSLSIVQPKFLSVTIDTYEVKMKWREFDFTSQKMLNLASALAPSDLRFGGTYTDFMTFDPNGDTNTLDQDFKEPFPGYGYMFDSGFFEKLFVPQNFTMTGHQWDNLTSFVGTVGWDLMVDLNLFYRRGGLWDPTNADLLLSYSSQRGVKIISFQLGNEPNSYSHNFNITISPETMAQDFTELKNLLRTYPLYGTSGLYGPDVTNLNIQHGSVEFLTRFLAAGAYNVLEGISLHHYYLNARTAQFADFLNISTLESLRQELQLAVEIVQTSPRPLLIDLTETSSCFGGGTPGLSNTYMAGFLWLDKLGMSAQFGVNRVFRQTFLGAPYGLLADNSNPNPDFFLSVLFKRLVAGPVFAVSTDPPDIRLRIYAHCARNLLYSEGALVVYYLNLQSAEVNLTLPQFDGQDLDLYLLTPQDSLTSSFVRLNGQILELHGDDLPSLVPLKHRGPVTVTGFSFGFIVVPNSYVGLCLDYYSKLEKT